MGAKHTPGPWAVEELSDGIAFGRGRVDGSLETIISFVSTKDYHPSAHARYLADFTLAASAPDLLEALEAMVLNDRHTYRDCHKRALAAISRAHGAEQGRGE
jgi:hypothetical protein